MIFLRQHCGQRAPYATSMPAVTSAPNASRLLQLRLPAATWWQIKSVMPFNAPNALMWPAETFSAACWTLRLRCWRAHQSRVSRLLTGRMLLYVTGQHGWIREDRWVLSVARTATVMNAKWVIHTSSHLPGNLQRTMVVAAATACETSQPFCNQFDSTASSLRGFYSIRVLFFELFTCCISSESHCIDLCPVASYGHLLLKPLICRSSNFYHSTLLMQQTIDAAHAKQR